MATLSDKDKERCRYHLGYMGTSSAASIQLGIPRPVQTMFLVDQAMSLLVDPNVVERVKCILDILDGTERRMVDAQKQLGVEGVGQLRLRPGKSGETHTDLLEREYVRWAKRLADVLGAPLYAYADRFRGKTGAGMIRRG